MSRSVPRWVLGAVLVVAVLGAVAGGGTWAALQDTGPAAVDAGVVNHFEVTATVDSISPSELNTSADDGGNVTVELSPPAPADVLNSSFAASFENVSTGSVNAVQGECDSSGCTVTFDESDIESLGTAPGNYTLVVDGEYADGGTLAGTGAVELCDGNCDETTGDVSPVPIPSIGLALGGLLVTGVSSRG